MRTVITVDGLAGSGKTTLARLLSQEIDFIHLNLCMFMAFIFDRSRGNFLIACVIDVGGSYVVSCGIYMISVFVILQTIDILMCVTIYCVWH